ncbi:MAG: hypothetical protein WB802_05945 [Candidatus Dormiibacterota bacterium]|jgi:hypothetical protein
MNDDDHDANDFWALSRWWGFGSPVGLAILLIGLGGFLVLLAEAIAVPLSLFR